MRSFVKEKNQKAEIRC